MQIWGALKAPGLPAGPCELPRTVPSTGAAQLHAAGSWWHEQQIKAMATPVTDSEPHGIEQRELPKD